MPTPLELVDGLNQVVVGQDSAKRALALAAYRHYLGLAKSTGRPGPAFGKQHVLLLGPTGCGKTQLVRELALLLKVPVATVSATNYVETGYVGDKVENMVRELFCNADRDVAATERGLVFVDEADKIRGTLGPARDISGTGVQHALLKLLDGLHIPIDLGGRRKIVRTDGILFVFAGAFEGIDDIVHRRTQTDDAMGFRQAANAHSTAQRPSTTIADLVEFGMIRELLGRITTIAELRPLDVQTLARILIEPRDSWLRRARAFFAAHGADLHLSRSAIRALAERAAGHGTGARALDRVANAALEPTVWRLLRSTQPVARVEVTRPTVEKGAASRFRIGGQMQFAFHSLTSLEGSTSGPAALPCAEAGIFDTDWLLAGLNVLEVTLGLPHSKRAAQTWWRKLRANHRSSPAELHELARALCKRKSTINEAFLASLVARSDDLEPLLRCLDDLRLLHEKRCEQQ